MAKANFKKQPVQKREHRRESIGKALGRPGTKDPFSLRKDGQQKPDNDKMLPRKEPENPTPLKDEFKRLVEAGRNVKKEDSDSLTAARNAAQTYIKAIEAQPGFIDPSEKLATPPDGQYYADRPNQKEGIVAFLNRVYGSGDEKTGQVGADILENGTFGRPDLSRIDAKAEKALQYHIYKQGKKGLEPEIHLLTKTELLDMEGARDGNDISPNMSHREYNRLIQRKKRGLSRD